MPELVLYGIRELAQHYSRPMRAKHRQSSTYKSGPDWNLHVNKAGAGIQVFTDIESLVDILGEDTAGQTVLCHVGSLHDAFHVTSIELAHHLT